MKTLSILNLHSMHQPHETPQMAFYTVIQTALISYPTCEKHDRLDSSKRPWALKCSGEFECVYGPLIRNIPMRSIDNVRSSYGLRDPTDVPMYKVTVTDERRDHKNGLGRPDNHYDGLGSGLFHGIKIFRCVSYSHVRDRRSRYFLI